MSDVTQLLSAIDAGDPKASDQLLPLVYEKTRKLPPEKYSNTRGVIRRRKTPWTGDTTNQTLAAGNKSQ